MTPEVIEIHRKIAAKELSPIRDPLVTKPGQQERTNVIIPKTEPEAAAEKQPKREADQQPSTSAAQPKTEPKREADQQPSTSATQPKMEPEIDTAQSTPRKRPRDAQTGPVTPTSGGKRKCIVTPSPSHRMKNTDHLADTPVKRVARKILNKTKNQQTTPRRPRGYWLAAGVIQKPTKKAPTRKPDEEPDVIQKPDEEPVVLPEPAVLPEISKADEESDESVVLPAEINDVIYFVEEPGAYVSIDGSDGYDYDTYVPEPAAFVSLDAGVVDAGLDEELVRQWRMAIMSSEDSAEINSQTSQTSSRNRGK